MTGSGFVQWAPFLPASCPSCCGTKANLGMKCPKTYIPNTCTDPEIGGCFLAKCVALLMETMGRSNCVSPGNAFQDKDILNFVLLGTVSCEYCVPVDKNAIEGLEGGCD